MTHNTILVLNAGSSSIKFSLFDADDDALAVILSGQIEGISSAPRFQARDGEGTIIADLHWPRRQPGECHDYALGRLLEWLREHANGETLLGVGHRVVHGGAHYAQPVLIDAKVLADLRSLAALAPLHQPHNLAGIHAIAEVAPSLPQVACFDTAFHRGHPPVADRFALSRDLYEQGIRRYGFHGISYQYIASVLPERAPAISRGRTIVAHLGGGASLCAIRDGQSLDSTMGFTALDGLMMGTRCGHLDPGVILYLLTERGMTVSQLETLLYRESGLLGVSGISSDMRDLETNPEPAAVQAVDLFVYRVLQEIGSLTAVLGGLDGLVFTAGIGEHSTTIRQRICARLGWLGVQLDSQANSQPQGRISSDDSAVEVWVIPTDEERMIAVHTHQLTFQ